MSMARLRCSRRLSRSAHSTEARCKIAAYCAYNRFCDPVSTPACDPSAQMIVLDGQLYDAKSLELSKTQGEGATLSDSELEACALLLNKKKV